MRFVKRLVVALTSVMIVGLILILGLLVIRIGLAPAPLGLPDHIALPEGSQPEAVTLSHDWVIVLSREREVLFFDRSSGALRHRVELPVE